MPELAELALFSHDIRRQTEDSRLLKVEFPEDKWSETIVPAPVRKSLKAAIKRFPKFASFGKTLVMEHGDFNLAVKLGMTGRFSAGQSDSKHTFVRLFFENRAVIEYQDPRRFGRWKILSDEDEGTVRDLCLGWYDPDTYTTLKIRSREELLRLVQSEFKGYRTTPAITWLLRHGPNTGVGNYMANEALGLMDMNPFEPIRTDDPDADMHTAVQLLLECGDVARASFDDGGNSFAGGYFRLDGTAGAFDGRCLFYRAKDVPRYSFRGRPVYTPFRPKVGLC